MIGAISSALSGLMTASKKVEAAADNIANVSTPGREVDLAEEAVNLKLGEVAYKANLATIKAAESMNDELMHLFDEKV